MSTLRRSARRLAASSSGVNLDPIALVEQVGDLHLAVDRALATDLRRMRGQDRAAQGVIEEALHLLARQPRLAGAAEA